MARLAQGVDEDGVQGQRMRKGVARVRHAVAAGQLREPHRGHAAVVPRVGIRGMSVRLLAGRAPNLVEKTRAPGHWVRIACTAPP